MAERMLERRRYRQRQKKPSVPPPTPSSPPFASTLPVTPYNPSTSHLPSSSHLPSTTSQSSRPPTSSSFNSTAKHPRTSQCPSLTPSHLSLYSTSFPQLEISSVQVSCQEKSSENKTQLFLQRGSGTEYEALLRRGNTLIVHVTTTIPLTSSYTLTLTFISAYRSNDRFGQFRAKGSASNVSELWFSITLPSNFPVGKFHYHVHLSANRGIDVATYHHNKPVAVLFNPWLPDDDVYVENGDDIDKHLLSEVGIIWRGTAKNPRPLLWEYGQYASGCLDVVLDLLHGLNADDRRSAASVTKYIVAQVNSREGRGVMRECYSGSYTGGIAPCRWNGSPAILQRFHSSQQPVRYGQCWVLAGVTVTLLRALGIASRPVTGYDMAQHCSKPRQLDFAFTPQGDLLHDATHDQLWVYHVWVEAWMRRDDLPPGSDGWQVLDPTSRREQGGVCRVGPVPVVSIKKEGDGGGGGGGGKKSIEKSNGAEYVVSSVTADMRFLRVSKSYSNITNRVMSVALVLHNKIGIRLLAGDSTSTVPLDLTNLYKSEEFQKSQEPSSLPSRDCSVEMVMGEGRKLGDLVELTVTVCNHGHHLRTLDGRVEGHIIRYCGVPVRGFMSMQFSGVVAPGQSASVSVPVEAKQYVRHLVEQCMMQLFVAVKARESGQLFLKVHHYQPQLPSIEVKLCEESSIVVGKMTRIRLTFRNTLSCSLSRLLFLVQAQDLCPQKELPYRRIVLPGAIAKVEFPLRAKTPGTYHIVASLHCDQLTDVHGWAIVTAVASS